MNEFSLEYILNRIDLANDHGNFPPIQMEGYFNAGIKLKVFRNDTEWLIIYESIDFTTTDYTFINHIRGIGNKIDEEGFYDLNKIINETAEHPFFDENSYDIFLLNPFDFVVSIKNMERDFIFTETDYLESDIAFRESNVPTAAKILRLLVKKIPTELFFSNIELLELCRRNNNGLKLFLEPDYWNHPDIINDLLPPSNNFCVKSIAEAIENNDPTLFKCPPEFINSHWSFWE